MKYADHRFHSLLYVDPGQRRLNVNLGRAITNPLDIYIGCARLLAASCRHFGVPYCVVTNAPEYVRERVERLGGGVEVLGSRFDRAVPEDIAFHSAHFKLDLLREFGRGTFGEAIGLLDLDMVLVRPLAPPLSGAEHDTLCVYDISDQERSSYGKQQIAASIFALDASLLGEDFWYGGEFIAGSSASFRRLSDEIDHVWPLYAQTYGRLHHMGDEMVVTVALRRVQLGGTKIVDVGAATCPTDVPVISRFWSGRTLFRQRPFSQASAAFLHLPADKPFLASMAREPFSPEAFLNAYHNHLSRKLSLRRIVNPLLNWRSGIEHYVAEL